MIEVNSNPLVTIRCLTYNHEPYIRQCLEGFVMQKTNFKFEAIVHDDASTDGTAAIIREYAEKYPDIIKPIYESENQYSKKDGSLGRIMDAHTRGKYVAMCEGDDYWTDPLKLQKQVDFLESHPEYVMCSHFFQNFIQDTKSFEGYGPISTLEDKSYDFDYYIKREAWITHPLSIMYRNSVLDSSKYRECKFRKDLTLFYFLLKEGKGFLMKDVMAVYRKHSSGVWSGSSRQKRISDDIKYINCIYCIEKNFESTFLLYNYLYKNGYLGISFLKRNPNTYIKALKIICKHMGTAKTLLLLLKNLKYTT